MIKFVGVDAHIDPQNNNNGPMWASAPTIKSIVQTTIYSNKRRRNNGYSKRVERL